MSFEAVERLKRDYTDKWVTVDTATPELRRFVGLSGQIKTVNMNGRALVQFDNPVDISWYDIDLSYLKVINAPAPNPIVSPTTRRPGRTAKESHAPTRSEPDVIRPHSAASSTGGV